MDDIAVGVLVFVCVFAGAVIGLTLYRLLPNHHLTTETRDVVRLGIGMISILASLVLGLLTASAKNTYDLTDQKMRAYAADLILLDTALRDYGDETLPIRKQLLDYAERAVRGAWPASPAEKLPLEDKESGRELNVLAHDILTLKPATEAQTWLRHQALNETVQLVHTRMSLLVHQQGSISPILLVIMVIWISVIFASFGLNAPRNGTVVAAFLVCSMSIGASIFLILEMDTPFDGVIAISGEPMKNALAHLRE